jgi:hypothetical protein
LKAVFSRYQLTADIAEPHRQGFTGWQVNGRYPRPPLKFKAEHEIRIEAVFNNKVTSPADAPAMVSPAMIPVTKAPGVWRRFPRAVVDGMCRRTIAVTK